MMRISRSFAPVALILPLLAAVLPPEQETRPVAVEAKRLVPPASGKINVAFVISEDANLIDFAGPWEVFQDVMVSGRGSDHHEQMPFRNYTVSDSRKPVRVGMSVMVVPEFTFDDAPPPRVVVVGAQTGKSKKMMDWLRRYAREGDVVMSVCTGAFRLGLAGILDGKPATTHHAYYDEFTKYFPKARLIKDRRFVQSDPVIATAGGLTSGFDLALHVVERYFGREAAQRTANYMEYEGKGWMREE
jgi:transcriptional regulator GlxA family with amidase domain